MGNSEQRAPIYWVLLVICGAISICMVPAAGLWSFLQVATVIEGLRWLGEQEPDRDAPGQG
jgi:hypothetical protein